MKYTNAQAKNSSLSGSMQMESNKTHSRSKRWSFSKGSLLHGDFCANLTDFSELL